MLRYRDAFTLPSSPSPHFSSKWGEGRGEGRRQTPTLEQAAAPHPNPLPTEEWGEGTARRPAIGP